MSHIVAETSSVQHSLILLSLRRMSKAKKPAGSRHTASSSRSFLSRRMASIGIFFFSLLLYVNTIQNSYSLDDEYVVLSNESVKKGVSGIPDILTTPYSTTLNMQHTEYRAVVRVSYAIEYQFFGANPQVSHFIQCILYGLLCVTLFILLLQLFPTTSLLFPLSATLLFAAHPLHTEVVASLKNREEILSLLFSLISIFFFIKSSEKGKALHRGVAVLFFLLGLATKTSSAVLVVWVPLIQYFVSQDKKWLRPILTFVSLLLLTLLFTLAINHYVLGLQGEELATRRFDLNENPLSGNMDIFVLLGTAMNSMGFYLLKLLFPYSLNYYYGYNMIPLQPLWALRPLSFFFVSVALLVISFRGLAKREAMSLSLLLFLSGIAPYLNIIALVPGIVAERLAFFSSIGFCMSVALLLLRLSSIDYREQKQKGNFLFLSVLAGLLLLYSARTVLRNRDWKDKVTLVYADMPKLNNSFIANIAYSFELYNSYKTNTHPEIQNKPELVLKHLNRALAIRPDAEAQAFVATVLSTEYKDYKGAKKHILIAAQMKPNTAQYHFDLGTCYQNLQQGDSAYIEYHTAISLDSTHVPALTNLAVIYSARGQQDSAIYYNSRAMHLFPINDAVQANMGFYYQKKGDFNLAKNYFENALSINPNRQDVKDAMKEMGF